MRTLDLYYDGFDPVLDLESWHAHRQGRRHSGGLTDHVTALRDCEALVFVYPTWWYGMPAMLKGWFDRVWQPGVAFTLKNGEFETHTLANIRRLAVITTCGSPALGLPSRRWRAIRRGDSSSAVSRSSCRRARARPGRRSMTSIGATRPIWPKPGPGRWTGWLASSGGGERQPRRRAST